MTKAQVSEAMDMAIGAGKTISAIQREALREAYALMPGNTDKQ